MIVSSLVIVFTVLPGEKIIRIWIILDDFGLPALPKPILVFLVVHYDLNNPNGEQGRNCTGEFKHPRRPLILPVWVPLAASL